MFAHAEFFCASKESAPHFEQRLGAHRRAPSTLPCPPSPSPANAAAAMTDQSAAGPTTNFNYLKTGAGKTERKALCICCSYPGTQLALPGCVRDQAAMVDMLPKQGYDVTFLTDGDSHHEKPTKVRGAAPSPRPPPAPCAPWRPRCHPLLNRRARPLRLDRLFARPPAHRRRRARRPTSSSR